MRNVPIVMSAGAVEYHGPHLPIGSDWLLSHSGRLQPKWFGKPHIPGAMNGEGCQAIDCRTPIYSVSSRWRTWIRFPDIPRPRRKGARLVMAGRVRRS